MFSVRACLLAWLVVLGAVPAAWALETITYHRENRGQSARGEVLRETNSGQLLVKQRDGSLLLIEGDEILDRESDDEAWTPLSRDELFESVSSQLQVGFERHDTANYLIVYNTTDAYAEWCGALFERLHFGFTNYWGRRVEGLQEPEMPLVAIVFRDKASYTRMYRAEAGRDPRNSVGFYTPITNRMYMFDLTGVEQFTGGVQQLDDADQINLLLSQPLAAETVATIVHEATHQLAFNCGLQVRYGDNPFWLAEGIATYFETPDLNSRRGWRGIGEVSADRLGDYLVFKQAHPENTLRSLIQDDERFHNPNTTTDAYDEAWILTHYLSRRYQNALNGYVREISEMGLGHYDTPAERAERFETAFGKTIEEIEEELQRYAVGLAQ